MNEAKGKFREQAIKDAAEATDIGEEGIQECLNAPNDGSGYLLLEDSATIYAVAQRELVLEQAETIRELREALQCFLGDPRFSVSIGGNPHAVEQMLTTARAALARFQ